MENIKLKNELKNSHPIDCENKPYVMRKNLQYKIYFWFAAFLIATLYLLYTGWIYMALGTAYAGHIVIRELHKIADYEKKKVYTI